MLKKYLNILLITIIIFLLFLVSILSISLNFKTPYFVMEYYSALNDGSINEVANDTMISSINKYNKEYNQNHNYKAVYLIKDKNVMISSFSSFLDNDTAAIFTSGFLFEDSINQYQNYLEQGYIIYIDDGSMNFTKENNENSHISSISILEVYSGFIAGFLTGIYLTTEYDNYEDWKAGLWGGFPFPSIISFMSGYERGIEFFKEITSPFIANVDKMKIISPFEGESNEEKWYTNSFELDNSGKTATINLINKGANVIYPIAGIQTKEALDYIKNTSSNAKVIGVDSDATLLYPGYESIVLFSTIKDFVTPIEEDVSCFYKYDFLTQEYDLSNCLEENEVYASEVIFNNGDSSYFDEILINFFDKYNFELTWTTEELIKNLELTSVYNMLKENMYSCTFSTQEMIQGGECYV